MKRLWKVEFCGTCYVMAETARDAEEVALIASRDDDYGAGLMADAEHVLINDKIESGWVGAIPYGGTEPLKSVHGR